MKKKKQWVGSAVNTIVTAILAFLFLFPVFYAFMSSFKTNGEILKSPMALPSSLNWEK